MRRTENLISSPGQPARKRGVHRHALPVRLWHWLNVIAVFVLLGSGLSIFNAHPRLYWGQYGANFDPAWMEIGSRDEGQEGFLRIGPLEVETTGILGVFEKDGSLRRRAWPHYLTIPADYSLAQGRLYHLFTAWIFGIAGLAYALWSVAGRHFRRDLLPARKEMAPRHIWHDVKQHARLRLPKGEAALRYNILQKLSYLFVLFVLLPMMVLTGLAMSPNMNAAWPWLLDLFGGRQSARSLHFIAAFLIAGFILVHIIMVIAAGPLNEIRSMITGRFRIREDRP